jgi:hypothetical protein
MDIGSAKGEISSGLEPPLQAKDKKAKVKDGNGRQEKISIIGI